jgi:hypothetical protein
MTTIYTGSNYGIISTLNSTSVSTSLLSLATSTFGNYELVKNYTAGSILLKLTGATTSGYCNILIEYSTDNAGTIVSTETHSFNNYTTSASTTTIQFKPQGAYCRIRLYNGGTGTVAFEVQTRFNNSNDPDNSYGTISSANSFNFTSSPSLPFNGTFEDISQASIITLLLTGTSTAPPAAVACTMDGIFSSDGINDDRIVSYVVQDATANGSASTTTSLTFNPAHTLLPIAKYFRVRVTLTSGTADTLRCTTTYHTNKSKALTSRTTQNLTDQFDSDTARSILVGRTLGTLLPQGHYQNIGVQNQSIATFIRDPTTAFGELLTAQLTPLIQYDFSNGEPYEVMLPIIRNEPTKSSYTYSNAFLNLTVGTSPAGTATNSYIQSQSSEYTKYKAGEGIDMRMTAIFDSTQPTSGCDQYMGLYTSENSVTFGYFTSTGTNYGFGIRYGRAGVDQVVYISVAGTSGATGTISLSFGGTTVTTASLPSGSTNVAAAAAINNVINSTTNLNTFGWSATYYTNNGGTTYVVQAIRKIASAPNITVTTGSAPTGYTITYPTGRSGVSTTYQYIPQNSWNIDRCINQGSLQQNYLYNPSGFQLDPTKGNVYRISLQYLGFGSITFSIENPTTGTFMPVHQIQYANSSATSTSFTSPNFRLTYGVENTTYGGTITLKAPSASCFTQGAVVPAPLYRSYSNTINTNTLATISKDNSRVLFGFRILQTKTSVNSDASTSITINRSNLFFNSISAAINTAGGGTNRANITFQLVKNPTQFYVGDPTTTVYNPTWRVYERDSTIIVFDGTVSTSTTTGVGYTGGVNVFDLPLVENTASTFDMRQMLVNASTEDIYIVSFYGVTSGLSSYDILGAITYQVNN